MPSLRDVQARLGAFVLAADDDRAAWDLDSLIVGRGLLPAERLAIHRNTTRLTLTDALGALYPVVARLVGEAFFAHAARQFIRRHPPTSGALIDWGDAFPVFLERFPAARPLAYLADVARLEWAWHEAFHGPDADPLPPDALEKAIPEAGRLVLALHPTLHILRSPYPIDRIWTVNRASEDPEEVIDLDEGGGAWAVVRPWAAVDVVPLPTGAAAFLEALAGGSTLDAAVEAGGPCFELVPTLALVLSRGWVVGFSLAKEENP